MGTISEKLESISATDRQGAGTRLLLDFVELRRAASGLESPNPEDDECIKLAIIGFSLHEQTERWSRAHYEFILKRHEEGLSEESLRWFEESAPSVAAFSCLALGAMQGLYSKGKIDDAEFLHGDAFLPGFVMMNIEQIQERHETGASG